MNDSNFMLQMKTAVDDAYTNQCCGQWENSIYKNIEKLKLDYVGKIGELFLRDVCERSSINFMYDGDVNSTDGTYDIIIQDRRVEMKTARMGKSSTFQHEGLRNEGCDFYVFLDIAPFCMYLTIIPKFDLTHRCDISNRKPHLRRGTSDVFKFDFSVYNLNQMIEKLYTIKIDENTHPDTLKNFLDKKLNPSMQIEC